MTSEPNPDKLLEVAITAAQAAGEIITTNAGGNITASFKSADDIVTNTDLAAEKTIKSIILNSFPNHGIFGEEMGSQNSDREYVWVIDPLDGTTNFAHNISHYCVSIALLHKGITKLGVVYAPRTDELFTAQAGQGAKLNNQAITSSNQTNLKQAVISFNRNTSPAEKKRFSQHIFPSIAGQVRTIRILGSTALEVSYTATGRLDAMIDNQCKLYDGAAATIIAQEAGAIVTDFTGQPWQPGIGQAQDLLVAPQAIHQEFIALLKDL